MKNSEDYYAEIVQLCKDKGNPIIALPFSDNEELFLALKKASLEQLAEFLIIGDEIEIEDTCRRVRMNPDSLYGAVNPASNPHLELLARHFQKAEEITDWKAAVKKAKSVETLSEWMVKTGNADLYWIP